MASAKYITEVLKEINDDVSLLKTTYPKIGDGGPLGQIFQHAFMAEHKWLLPEGEPPFKPDAAPMGMSPARFIQEVRKFNIFKRTDLKSTKREQLFIGLCESVHPDEAKILIAIKDQKLTDLYPNITREVVAAAGYIPALSPTQVKEEAVQVKKSGRPRGRPRKSESPQPVL